MDRGAWHAAVCKGHKESDTTERTHRYTQVTALKLTYLTTTDRQTLPTVLCLEKNFKLYLRPFSH